MEHKRNVRLRHPPGLRGRNIGLYFRHLSQKNKKIDANKILLGPSVSVPQTVLTQVDESLRNCGKKCEEERIVHEFEVHCFQRLRKNFDEFVAEFTFDGCELQDNEHFNQRFKSELLSKEKTKEFQERYQQRLKLPIMKQNEYILSLIRNNQVVLIIGSTGCGKTTQIPQLLLDYYIYDNHGSQCHIVCTQPRRISALTVAERVAFERCESLGTSVGYQIRLESQIPRETGSILYCTTGILLQKLQTDPLLNCFSAVVLDEIHERSVESDILLGFLKKILPHRPSLKLILMSATVSEKEFSEYFNNCSTIHIEGSVFPVKVNYLEDIIQETGFTRFRNNFDEISKYKRNRIKNNNRLQSKSNLEYINMIEPYLRQIRDKYDANVLQALRYFDSEGCENFQFLEHLIFYICEHKPPGAILVFLPGYDKISKLHAVLQKPTSPIGQRFCQRIQVYLLHSMMSTLYQKSVFSPSPPGVRKIILSTTVAETSVTVNDVVYVINTGRIKISSYNIEGNIQTLEETWATRANSLQRKGRAGRVQPGICFNLFTKVRERFMEEKTVPEILRSKLETTILNLKLLHITDVSEFLETLLSPPNSIAVQNGVNLLKRMNALDAEGIITPLGMHLARLPTDPQMGKMIVMAALFRCLDPITSVAAGLSYKSPFYTPLGKQKEVDRVKHEISARTNSDHLLINNAIINYRESLEDGSERDYCYKHFLNISTLQQLEEMKKQLTVVLKSASFIESVDCKAMESNVNSQNVPLLRAIIAAGLYPNMAYLRKIRRIKNQVHAIHHLSTPEEKNVNFHPTSVNSNESIFDSNYFVYFQKLKSTAVYLLDATMVFPMALIIFGDGIETGYTPDNVFYIKVAQNYYFKCDPETVRVILDLRGRLEWLMQKKALNPSPIAPNSSDEYLIKAIRILLSLDDVYDYGDQHFSSEEL